MIRILSYESGKIRVPPRPGTCRHPLRGPVWVIWLVPGGLIRAFSRENSSYLFQRNIDSELTGRRRLWTARKAEREGFERSMTTNNVP